MSSRQRQAAFFYYVNIFSEMWQFRPRGVKVLTIDNSQELTIHDFIKNKEHQPFKRWRTISKTINFGLIFGCTAPTFAGLLKQANFTEAECDEFIQLTNNTQAYNAALANNMGSIYESVMALGASETSVLTAWIGCFAYTMQIYFDFGGFRIFGSSP